MTVGDLKRYLSSYDDNLLIVLSSDPEGNSYNHVHVVDKIFYDIKNREIVSHNDEDNFPKGTVEAVCLWP